MHDDVQTLSNFMTCVMNHPFHSSFWNSELLLISQHSLKMNVDELLSNQYLSQWLFLALICRELHGYSGSNKCTFMESVWNLDDESHVAWRSMNTRNRPVNYILARSCHKWLMHIHLSAGMHLSLRDEMAIMMNFFASHMLNVNVYPFHCLN